MLGQYVIYRVISRGNYRPIGGNKSILIVDFGTYGVATKIMEFA